MLRSLAILLALALPASAQRVTSLTSGTPTASDLFDFVDVEDITMAATGTNKKILFSALQTALNFQTLDSDLTAIAALTTTAFGRGLLDDADATAVRLTIGAVIGTNVQAYDADLDDLADGNLSVARIALALTTPGPIGGSTPSTGVFTTATVNDEAYNATGWNAALTVPTKNAIRDQFEANSVLVVDPGADKFLGWDNTDDTIKAVDHADIALVLPIANGGTATATPALVAGTNVTITGTWPNNTINSSGGSGDMLATLTAAEISVTGAVTATISRMHVCTGTTADYTVTLPAVSGNTGKLIGFRMSPALTKLVTIDGNASENIDGALTRVMWAQETAILLCDGSNWVKVTGRSVAMRCLMAKAADQTGIISASATKIDLDTAVINPALLADTTNKRITIRRAGTYLCTAGVRWAAIVTANAPRLLGYVDKNGTTPLAPGETSGLIGAVPKVSAPASIDLVAGDFIELEVYQTSGVNQDALGTGDTGGSTLEAQELLTW